MGMTPQHFHTIPTSCAILPPLTQICFVCLLVMCRGLWKWVVLGVHVGSGLSCGWLQCTMYLLYWAWQIWSVLPVFRNCGVHAAVLAGSVWYVYMGNFNAATYSKHVHVPKQLSEHSKRKTNIRLWMYTLNETVWYRFCLAWSSITYIVCVFQVWKWFSSKRPLQIGG